MGRMFEVRKRSMFARYDRMAKAFTRCGREIVIAVRESGPDPDINPALRRAIQNARAVNMPKDRIEGAIKRASGKDAENYTEVLYEAYGPAGSALMIETATDNPTRTIANLRLICSRNGGNMGSSGSVAYQFQKMGVFQIPADEHDPEELELSLIDFGLEDLGETVAELEGKEIPVLEIRAEFASFGAMQSALEEQGLKVVSAKAAWIPETPIALDEENEEAVLKLVDLIEADEDVQDVFHNLG